MTHQSRLDVRHPRLANSLAAPVLAALGLVLWVITVLGTNYSNMGDYGLVSLLRWPYFAGLTLVVIGFAAELMRARPRSSFLLLLIAVLVVYLYGTACAVEPVAELTDSFIHAGFIQYILQHGQPLNGYDARFSWPGGFSMAAMLVAFVGKTSALSFLHWFPFFIELSYLAPLVVIARCCGAGERAGWLGIALYYANNWIFQDYFSPQALNYLFFLVVLATVLAIWRPIPFGDNPATWRTRWRRTRQAAGYSRFGGDDAWSDWESGAMLVVLAILGAILLASSMSHQLTPYALILSLGACLATRRLGRPELVVLVGVFAFGWLSLGASNYWVGHLSDIFGSAGQFSSTVSANVTSRVGGASSHLLIVDLRILTTGGLLLLAGVGALRRSTDSRVLEALVAAPFFLLLAQSYGGEGLMRVVLYGLPFSAILAASAVLPSRSGEISAILPQWVPKHWKVLRKAATRIAVVVVVLGFALANTVVRGGNDAYVSFSTAELAAVNYVYDHIKPGQTIGLPNYFMPIGQRDVGTVTEYVPNVSAAPTSYRRIGTLLVRRRPSFIILSKSEEAYGEEVSGYPIGWEQMLESTLVSHGYRIAAKWTTAEVLRTSN